MVYRSLATHFLPAKKGRVKKEGGGKTLSFLSPFFTFVFISKHTGLAAAAAERMHALRADGLGKEEEKKSLSVLQCIPFVTRTQQ